MLWTPNGKWKTSMQALQHSGGIMTEVGCFYFCLEFMSSTLWIERSRLRVLRETFASRRRSLSAAKFQLTCSLSRPLDDTSREAQELAELSATIARARSGLVQELVEVFNIVEVGGRPSIGSKAGTKGEWKIGDLILPVPGDIRRKFPLFLKGLYVHHLQKLPDWSPSLIWSYWWSISPMPRFLL